MSWLTNVLYGSHLTDVATAIKLVSAEALQRLNLVGSGFDLDFELVNKLLLAGYEIHEVPLEYQPRTYAQGKKIRIWDGLFGMWIIVRDRIGLSPALKVATQVQGKSGPEESCWRGGIIDADRICRFYCLRLPDDVSRSVHRSYPSRSTRIAEFEFPGG